MNQTRQIFQTENTSRWKKVTWSTRFILFFLFLLIASLLLMMKFDRTPKIPFQQDYKSVITATKPFLQENKLSKEYKGFRKFIAEKNAKFEYEKVKNERAFYDKYDRNWYHFPAGIRSAFYVAWDPQSLMSLRRNVKNLNLVFPEWFFIDPKTGDLKTNIDNVGLGLLKKSKIPVMPILSNNFDREFHSEGVKLVLRNPERRKKLIQNVLNTCLKNHFIGINIDFEDLNLDRDEPLTQFVKELSETFHQNKLYVTQDIMPDFSQLLLNLKW